MTGGGSWRISDLQLPTDYPRSVCRRQLRRPPPLWRSVRRQTHGALAALAQREGATLYMALVTAFAALSRYSGRAIQPSPA